MALVVGDVFRIVVRGMNQGEQWENIYYYKQTTVGVATALEIATNWWADFKATWRAYLPAVGTAVTTDTILMEEIADDGIYAEYAIPVGERPGLRAVLGALLPSFCAVGAKLVVESRLTRPGSKRWVGAGEDDLSGQNYAGPILTTARAFGDALVAGFSYGLVDAVHAELVVYGDVIEPTADDPVGRPVPVTNPVTAITVAETATSQVSRKVGRGA